MSDKWLTPEQASETLGCSVRTIRAMLRDSLLSGEKVKGQWRVRATEIERIGPIQTAASALKSSGSLSLPKIDPGMVEVSMALAGIAAAIAAIVPGVTGVEGDLKWFVALLAGVLAVFSAYSGLWLLALYCVRGDSPLSSGHSLFGFEEIRTLLTEPGRFGPYWFLALALLIWLLLSALIGALAVVR